MIQRGSKMNYVEVLSMWCMRHGVTTPSYEQTYKCTECTFCNKTYTVDTMGRNGLQEAAHKAYVYSGTFGNIRQVGFAPAVYVLDEVIMDIGRFYPDTLTLAIRDATTKYPEAPISILAPYNHTQLDTLDPTISCNYTVYSTVDTTEEALWVRIEWYIVSRMKTWVKYDTQVHIYSNEEYGGKIKEFLEVHGIMWTLE
jgi:hypothetical protein